MYFPRGLRSPLMILFLIMIILLAINLFTYSSSRSFSSAGIWRGFKPVFLSDNLHNESSLDSIETLGIPAVSWFNTRVEYFNYREEGLSSLPLHQIPERFEEQDPRWDQYMRDLKGYFYQPERPRYPWTVYLESELSNSILITKLKGIFADGEWKLNRPGRGDTHIFFLVLLYSGFLVFLLILKKGNLLYLTGLLPYFGLLAGGDPSVFVLPCFISLFWWMVLSVQAAEFFSYYWTYRILDYRYFSFFKKGIIYLAVLLISSFLSGLLAESVRLGLLFLLSGAGSLLLLWGYYLWSGIFMSTREHTLFFSEALTEKPAAPYPFRISKRLLPILLLFIIPASFAGGTLPKDPVPLPVPITKEGIITWDSLSYLAELNQSGDLPDLSDYLTHRAFQEGFLYGREYLFPVNEETINLSRYIKKNGEIAKEEIEVKQFTEKWYIDIMEDAKSQGITRLLIKQEVPVRVYISVPAAGSIGRKVLVSFLGVLTFLSFFIIESTCTFKVECFRRKIFK